jgi:hypothetical protein
VVASVATDGDLLVAIDCSRDATTLLTSRRLVGSSGGKQSEVKLASDVTAMGVASVTVAAEQVFVGINKGEWGGGLRRIDRRTGGVTAIEHNESGSLCGGPLNGGCDRCDIGNVDGKPGCFAAAIDRSLDYGRIVQVTAMECARSTQGLPAAVGGQRRRTPTLFGLIALGSPDRRRALGHQHQRHLPDRGDTDVSGVAAARVRSIGNIGAASTIGRSWCHQRNGGCRSAATHRRRADSRRLWRRSAVGQLQ